MERPGAGAHGVGIRFFTQTLHLQARSSYLVRVLPFIYTLLGEAKKAEATPLAVLLPSSPRYTRRQKHLLHSSA